MPTLDEATPELTVLRDLEPAWQHRGTPAARLRAVERAGRALRERLCAGPSVDAVRTLPLVSVVYPTKYAFRGAALSPAPYISFVHRCLLVQFRQRGAHKTLLFNPTDYERSTATPYYAELLRRYGKSAELLATRYDPLEAQLAALGLGPSDVDYVAFDHFHTQDLRRQLGTLDAAFAPRFPNAVLLAPESEWAAWDDPHPLQRAWFVPDGRAGVREDRVLRTAHDLQLGDGVLLLRTPGHTTGNQTLFVKTSSGVWGCSENGVCADSWSPLASKIPGLRREAQHTGVDLILNANTLENAADQYASMTLERALVDRVPERPEFCQMLASSELERVWFAPLLAPTHRHGGVFHGAVTPREGRSA